MMQRFKNTILTFYFLVMAFGLNAQQIDSSFAINGYIPYGITGNSQQNLGKGNKMAIQADGKIVVAVDKDDPNGPTDLFFYTYRYNADGTTDTTYGVGGASKIFTGSNSKNKDLKIQADGKIIVVGESEYCINGICGAPQFVMMRILPNGMVDSSFGTNGVVLSNDIFGTTGTYANPIRVALASNNKYIVCGRGPGYTQFIARLNYNGGLDNTFGTNGIFSDSTAQAYIRDMALDANENIYALFQQYSTPLDTLNYSDNYVLKLNANGTPNTAFGNAGKEVINVANDEVPSAIALRTDGKLVLVGSFRPSHATGFGETDKGYVVVLNADGSMSTLLNSGYTFLKLPGDSATFIHSVTMTPNGDMLLGGQTMTKINGNYHQKAFLSLMKDDASFNTTFNTNGILMLDHGLHSNIGSLADVLDTKLLSGNKLLCVGYRNPIQGNVKKSVYLLQLKNVNVGMPSSLNEEYALWNDVVVYPNPSYGKVTVLGAQMNQMTLFNILGEKMMEVKKSNEMDLHSFPKGLYYLFVEFKEGKTCRQIVLE